MRFNNDRLNTMQEVAERVFKSTAKSYVVVLDDFIITVAIKKDNKVEPQHVFDRNDNNTKVTGQVTKMPRAEATRMIKEVADFSEITFSTTTRSKSKTNKNKKFLEFLASKYNFDIEAEQKEFEAAEQEAEKTNAEILAQIEALRNMMK